MPPLSSIGDEFVNSGGHYSVWIEHVGHEVAILECFGSGVFLDLLNQFDVGGAGLLSVDISPVPFFRASVHIATRKRERRPAAGEFASPEDRLR